jgi:6-pyruvoyltetrahydropterin/6-carboxytetrahydropterin synthase
LFDMSATPFNAYLSAAAGFEAACRIGALPDGHRARRLHGHSYLARVRTEVPSQQVDGRQGEQVAQLRAQLEQCVAPLDHTLLNDSLPEPTDENLARWVAQRLADEAGAPAVLQTGMRSTLHTGVDLDPIGHAHVWRRYRFQAAHRLPHVPLGHQCGRMHGHGFEVILHANRTLSEREDLSIDYDRLDDVWAPVHFELNYRCLNEVPGLENPTSEVIAAWLWQRLKPELPELSWVTVYETGSSGANFDGTHYRIWKEMTLDSAVRVQRSAADSPLRRIHGHTFTLRLHLSAPLDDVMGWTVDFGDVKARFSPLFQRLDHHPLYEIPDLADGDALSIAHWVLREGRQVLPQLDRLDVYETLGCGAIVTAEDHGELVPV